MNFFFLFHSPFTEKAPGAQRGDFPKAIARGNVKIQAQVCLTPPPRCSLWHFLEGHRPQTLERTWSQAGEGWLRAGVLESRTPRAKWQQVPFLFNLGHLQCFSQVCWDPLSSLLVPPSVVPLSRPQSYSWEKTTFCYNRIDQVWFCEFIIPARPQVMQPQVFKNTLMCMHTRIHTHTPHTQTYQNDISGEKKMQQQLWGHILLIPSSLEKKPSVLYEQRMENCISEKPSVQRQLRSTGQWRQES